MNQFISHIKTKYSILLLCLWLITSGNVVSQTAFYMPLKINESGAGTGTGTIWFGVHPSATGCIDAAGTLNFDDGLKMLEYELPPAPPLGNFDVRFMDFDASCPLTEGIKYDIRKYNAATQADTFKIKLQLGTGIRPYVFSWPAGLGAICDSMRLRDDLGGILVNINMLTSTRYSMSANLNPMMLIKYGAKPVPSTPPVGVPIVKPANGATNLSARPVLFEWDGAFGALQYFLEVASDTNFSNIVSIDTVLLKFSNDTPNDSGMYKRSNLNYSTKYFWRVRAKNNFGIGPYSSIFSFTTGLPPVPSKPILVYPDSGLSNVVKSPTLKWKITDNAETYHLIVATDTGFSAGAIVFQDSTLTDTVKLIGPLKGGITHYWKVKGKNVSGSGLYSNRFFFTTILTPPTVPALVFPANNDTAIVVNPTFRWKKSDDAVTYHLVINDSVGNVVHNDSTLTDTSKQVALTNFAIFRWKVQAKNAAGVSGFSSLWTFKTIIQIPAITILLNPANNDTNVVLTPTLSWNPVQFASRYELQVASDANFQTIIYSNANITVTSQLLPTLASNQRYYWHVRAANYAGSGPYSETRNFKTVLVPPGKVVLNTPLNNSQNILTNTTLSWIQAALADKYHFQLDTLITFTDPIYEDSAYIGLSKNIASLENNKTYFWRVRGWNRVGFGDYSDTWNFKTVSYPEPTTPVLVSPLPGARNVTLNIKLKWAATEYAEVYTVELSRDSIFSVGNRVLLDSTITVTERIVGPLTQITTYWWRVRAKNKAGYSPWSTVWKFRTLGDEAPSWLSPFLALETGMARDTVFFGVHTDATYGIDPTLGEYELPPIDEGMFDVRWVSPPRRPGVLGEGTRINYTPFVSFTQVDTYKVRFQPGTGSYPMNFSWSEFFIRGTCDSMRLKDTLGGAIMNVRMDLTPSAVLSDPSISSLQIIMWHPRPLGIKVEGKEIPEEFVLYPNYPNPFNPSTNIKFSIMKDANTRLIIYNVLGEKVKELINGYLFQGTYSVEWNGTNDDLQAVPSGVYLIKMTTDAADIQTDQTFSALRKMLLLK